MKKPLNILITGCGSEGVYGVIRSLRHNGERPVRLVGLDTNTLIAHQYRLDRFVIPPRRDDAKFLPFVLALARQERIDVVYPVPTAELDLFSRAIGRFEAQGQRVIVNTPESLGVANHKGRLYNLAKELHLECTPEFRIAHDLKELEKSVRELGYPGQKVCIKPPLGTGSQGFRILDAQADRLHLLLHAHPSQTTTRLEDLCDVLRQADSFPELIVMEHLPGEEYDVDVLAFQGRVMALIPRLNRAMWYGMSLSCRTLPLPEQDPFTSQIASHLGLNYVNSFTYRRNSAGKLKLLEINPRIPGSIIIAMAAGINMPYLAVKLALGEEFELPQPQWGLDMVRFWDELFIQPDGQISWGGGTQWN